MPNIVIAIEKHPYTIDCPYEDGDTIEGPEVEAINRFFAENCANAVRGKQTQLKKKGERQLTVAQMQEMFNSLAKEYSFGTKRTRTASSGITMVERILFELVRDQLVLPAIRARYSSIKEAGGMEKVKELVEKYIASTQPKVKEKVDAMRMEAKRRCEVSAEVGQADLELFGLIAPKAAHAANTHEKEKQQKAA